MKDDVSCVCVKCERWGELCMCKMWKMMWIIFEMWVNWGVSVCCCCCLVFIDYWAKVYIVCSRGRAGASSHLYPVNFRYIQVLRDKKLNISKIENIQYFCHIKLLCLFFFIVFSRKKFNISDKLVAWKFRHINSFIIEWDVWNSVVLLWSKL